MIEVRTIVSHEEWMRWRRADVTASNVAALFDVHPYKSLLALYSEKRGLEHPVEDNGAMRRGRLLESAVGMAVAEEHPEWYIVKATEYFRNPQLRLGCTPDFWLKGDARGLGVLQAKTVAPRTFKTQWDGQPPFWIALQTITEMMLTGAAWGEVAALVIDPYRLDCHIFDVPRHSGVERRIENAVADFWDCVAHDIEPKADYRRDAELLAALYPAETPQKTISLAGDNELPVILAERADLKKEIKEAEERCGEIEAELKHKMADAEIATLPGWQITWKTHHRKETIIPARDIRTLRITERKEREERE